MHRFITRRLSVWLGFFVISVSVSAESLEGGTKGWFLHGFPAHITDLDASQEAGLGKIAREFAGIASTRRKPLCVRVIGHAATWRGISDAEYCRRSIERASGAAGEVADLLTGLGLKNEIFLEDFFDMGDTATCTEASPRGICDPDPDVDVALVVGGRADREPLPGRPNLVDRTDKEARENRAWNRRVEFIRTATKPLPQPKPACTSRDIAKALIDMDLERVVKKRKEPRFGKKVHRDAIVCMSRKLASKIIDGDKIDDDFILRWEKLRTSTRPKPVWRNFMARLKKICKRRGKITEDDVIGVYNQISEPIENIIPPLRKVLMDLTPNPFGGESIQEIKRKIPECRAVNPIYFRSSDRATIYHCMRGWTRPALEDCFN